MSPQKSPTEKTLSTPSPAVWILLSTNGTVAAGVCEDHRVRVWSVADARLLQTFDLGNHDFDIAALSGDGRSLLIGDLGGGVRVWDTSGGQVQIEQRARPYLTAAAFSRDGRSLAIAAGPEPLRTIDLNSKRVLSELPATPGGYTALAYSRDGAFIASTDGQGVRVFDARTGKLVSQNTDFAFTTLAVTFAADGKQVFAAGSDRIIASIDTATGKTLRRTAKMAKPIFYLEVSPDGSELAAVSFNADSLQMPAPVSFWDATSLQKKTEWISAQGIHFGFGSWVDDGHFISPTATPEAIHFLRAK